MNMTELKCKFNSYAKAQDWDLRVHSLILPKDIEADYTLKTIEFVKDYTPFVGIFEINDYISASVVTTDADGEDVSGVEVIMSSGKILQNLECFKAMVIFLDCFTGHQQYWRNSVLNRLGLHNGSFVKGKKTESRGHIFKIVPNKSNLLRFSIINTERTGN